MLKSYDQGRLFGEIFGEGEPAVLALPGWRRSHDDFSQVARGLSVSMLALDPPGFGSTPPPAEPWGAAGYAEAVARVFNEINTPVVVVGHSFGGRIAIHLAASFPDQVRALVLTGAPLFKVGAQSGSGRSPLAYRLVRLANRYRLVSEKRIEQARRKYGSEDYRAATGVMREVLVKAVNENYDEQIAKVACPVELVWGDDDTAAPLAGAQVLAQRLSRSTMTICSRAGHLIPVSAPDDLRAAIERALNV